MTPTWSKNTTPIDLESVVDYTHFYSYSKNINYLIHWNLKKIVVLASNSLKFVFNVFLTVNHH